MLKGSSVRTSDDASSSVTGGNPDLWDGREKRGVGLKREVV